MSAALANPLRGGTSPLFPELNLDSIWIKTASGLPLLGIFVQLMAENNLAKSTHEAIKKPPVNILEFRKAVKIKNQYKIIGVVRDLLTLAALVVLIALAILPSKEVVFLLPLLLITAGLQLYTHYKNSEMLLDIEQLGPQRAL